MKPDTNLKIALMVCTQARGGMRSVVEAYQRDGLFERWHFKSLWTHCEGNPFKKLFKGLTAYLAMLGLLVRGKVSFMHVHAAMRGSFWRKSFFILTARMFGVPCIMHLHGSEMKTFYNSLSVFGKRLVRWCLEHVEVVIVLSESWRAFVSQAAPQANITIVNNYVALPRQEKSKNDTLSFNVLFLGVLGQRKGIYDLLGCWPKVLKAVPNARLLIGGNGEVENASKVAQMLNLGASVEFLGWIDGDHKAELLKSADAFVLPSYNEGLPMSVLEAMSWAVPVVTTRVGGIPELITDEQDGFLIDAGNQEQLSNALISLGNNLDARISIGQAGYNRVKESFSDTAVLPKLEALYLNLSN